MKRVSLPVMTARLGEERVDRFWRSLDELASGPPAPVHHEGMPEIPGDLDDPKGRRRFMQLMGASIALAGAACTTAQPPETIVPYVRRPEEIIPGVPLFYATAMPLGGIGTGMLVETHMARPIKAEGNPQHPGSLGATDVFMQASVLGLYDPDRSKTVTYIGDIRSWSSFVGAMQEVISTARTSKGKGLCFLTEATSSPTLIAQMQALLAELPQARWFRYEPASRRASASAGANLVFGADVDTLYRFDQADVVASLDADFLSPVEGSVRYARDFMSRHRGPDRDARPMARLYVAESAPSLTGSRADHRVPVRAAEIERVARALAARLGVAVGGDTSLPPGVDPKWLDALVADLGAARGACLVVPGAYQTPAVHAIAHLINGALGAVGKTIVYTDPITPAGPEGVESIAELARAMDAGEVESLILLGGNPALTAPGDLRFAERMQKVRLRVHLGLYADETAALCHWHVPEAHFLEAWSDVRAYDGTATILQPMILPLYDGRSIHEIIGLFSGQPEAKGLDIVRAHWQTRLPRSGFEAAFRAALHDGVVPETASAIRDVTAKPAPIPETKLAEGAVEIVFRPDPSVYDGRFYTNAWLQECPRPLSKVVWDNVVWVSPATAKRLGLESEDVVELSLEGRTVKAPVWVMPGQPDDSFLVHLGYGRGGLGAIGGTHGFDAYRIRGSAAPWVARGLGVKKTGKKYPIATTQMHHTMEGRPVVLAAHQQAYADHPSVFHEMVESPPPGMDLYPDWKYPSYAWGMVIDTSACIGCNACLVACQSENNIPVVGKEEVANGREMHWIRVDRYFEGAPENPRVLWQPVPCMHCEKAPCEVVCPVTATVHHEEGLNDMVYNRCVGTRYCSNNCPYKVRRFNFFNYNADLPGSLRLRENPDVTVRSRGVMEKCSYCVQRINSARIRSQNEDRRIRDGEVMTACQAACPTGAIVFGDINEKNSTVRKLKDLPRNYALLADLNTRPRTTYLGTLDNPNPALTPPPPPGAEHQKGGHQ